MHVLVVQRPGSAPERRELAGALRAGGSAEDDLHLPGAPPGALRFAPCPTGAVLAPAAAGVRVGGRPVPAGSRRLLRPGERVEIAGAAIALERAGETSGGTRTAAASLLREAAAGLAALSGPHLVVLTGSDAGGCLPLGDEEMLGRGRRATLRLSDPHASRVHARIRIGPGGILIEDLSSKNGVRVNGVRVDGAHLLRPGDEITVGETSLALAPGAEGVGSRAAASRHRRRVPAPVLVAGLLAISAALALAGALG